MAACVGQHLDSAVVTGHRAPNHRMRDEPLLRRGAQPRRRAAWTTSAIVALLLVGCGASSGRTSGQGLRATDALPAGVVGGPTARVRLTDARGGVLDTQALRGRAYAVTFLYTHCPDVCPLIGAELRAALARLGPAAQHVAVVAITVDPRGDTRKAVEAWLRRHHEPANFHYLIGSERELAPVWRAYMAAPQLPGDPTSAHTASIWLVDPSGHRRALMSAGRPLNPADITYNLAVLTRGAR
jgi:protein SCO1